MKFFWHKTTLFTFVESMYRYREMNYLFAFTVSIHMQILLQIRIEINKATDLQSAYGVFYSVLIIL